ncbi:type II toxin-antitoxin system VapB family antitoxin [Methylobacterium oryzisoli]|uniref:type II toxin-antitoxin system VapB family antitoxin n=1 Tax=Methylobacterium oryzisoli TaxID=3385502 RepID=UPI003891C22E
MSEKLVIESDEAVGLASTIAERMGITPHEAVLRGLRALDTDVRHARPEWDRSAFMAKILALGETARAELPPGTTSDHSDLYDETGLPR